MIYWPPKEPPEVEDFAFEFADVLQDGETISSKEVTPNGVTVNSSAISGSQVQMWLAGGVAGTIATVTCTIVTSAGRTYVEEASLRISVEPISVADVKAYLGLFDSDRDAKISRMIPQARLWVEDYTGLALVRRTFEERRRPQAGSIYLFKGPLVSIESVTYGDDDTAYTPASFPPSTRLQPTSGSCWPALLDGDAFEIAYTAGFAEGEIDDRLIGAMMALIEGEFSEGYAYPERATQAAERCCGYLRTMVA